MLTSLPLILIKNKDIYSLNAKRKEYLRYIIIFKYFNLNL